MRFNNTKDEKFERVQNMEQQKVKYYSRVRKGMVFWYNPYPDSDYNDVHEINIGGKFYSDNRLYGNRPWIVVSGDEVNQMGNMIQIVPIEMNSKKKVSNTRVPLVFKGKDSLALCDYAMSVNAIELQQYDCYLLDTTIAQIDLAMLCTMGIKSIASAVNSSTLDRIEDVINSLVQKKISELTLPKANEVDIDDALLRISDGLDSLFDLNVKASKSEKVEVVEEDKSDWKDPNEGYNGGEISYNIVEVDYNSTDRRQPKRTYRRWDESDIIEFFHDDASLGLDEMMRKYDCRTKKAYDSLKARLRKKLEGLE